MLSRCHVRFYIYYCSFFLLFLLSSILIFTSFNLLSVLFPSSHSAVTLNLFLALPAFFIVTWRSKNLSST